LGTSFWSLSRRPVRTASLWPGVRRRLSFGAKRTGRREREYCCHRRALGRPMFPLWASCGVLVAPVERRSRDRRPWIGRIDHRLADVVVCYRRNASSRRRHPPCLIDLAAAYPRRHDWCLLSDGKVNAEERRRLFVADRSGSLAAKRPVVACPPRTATPARPGPPGLIEPRTRRLPSHRRLPRNAGSARLVSAHNADDGMGAALRCWLGDASAGAIG
jgi:hypothetical protein